MSVYLVEHTIIHTKMASISFSVFSKFFPARNNFIETVEQKDNKINIIIIKSGCP